MHYHFPCIDTNNSSSLKALKRQNWKHFIPYMPFLPNVDEYYDCNATWSHMESVRFCLISRNMSRNKKRVRIVQDLSMVLKL